MCVQRARQVPLWEGAYKAGLQCSKEEEGGNSFKFSD